MSIIDNYLDPTIIDWNTDSQGNKVAVKVENETIQVVNGLAYVDGIPDPQHRIQIDNYYEIDIRAEIQNENEFKVAYNHGRIYFHPNVKDIGLVVREYYSFGMWKIPASRVWIELDEFGDVTQSLNDITDIISNLTGSIITAEELKEDLDNRISTGGQLKTDLDDNIRDGNAIHQTLSNATNGTIKRATDINNTLEGNISTGGQLNIDLGNNISAGSQLDSNLQQSIEDAEDVYERLTDDTTGTIKQAEDLDESLGIKISTGGQLDTDLGSKISTGSQLDTDLGDKITTGGLLDSSLGSKISTGNQLDIDLNQAIIDAHEINDILTEEDTGTIYIANQTKLDLDGSISTGNSLKQGLDQSIEDGEELKEELDLILAGTDLGQVVQDITSLKQDQHTHDNKTVIDGLSDNNGQLQYNNADVGIGDMTKAEYDTNDNGQVDKADDADKLGGQLPNYYAKAMDIPDISGKADKTYVDNKVKTDVPINAIFTDTITEVVDNLESTDTDMALSANQGKKLNDKISILTDDLLELEYSELSSIATNLEDGIYKNIEWKRKDNTIYAMSTLLGTYPYSQIQIDYYDEDGINIIKSITWDLTYDDNDFPFKREVV